LKQKEQQLKTPVPLSAISFYSAPLHKKDAAAIGFRLVALLLRGCFFWARRSMVKDTAKRYNHFGDLDWFVCKAALFLWLIFLRHLSLLYI